jgi:nitroalkane oxidase
LLTYELINSVTVAKIGAATSDKNHEYPAGWTMSEPAGTPAGTANFDHLGTHPAGIGVVAELDKGKGEYVLNGRKYWRCNSGGSDLKGADVNVVIVRTAPNKGGKQGLSGMLVPRAAARGMRFEQPIARSAIGCDRTTISCSKTAECPKRTCSRSAMAT